MSKQIEERVVSMQFDNSRFERNVQTSMSTLDKLKQKLNLSGASKGLESVQTAASKVNMSGLASSVDTVSSRFSALEVMGVTALANITNSAVNAGKRIISALTIQPITTGFDEYKTQLTATQTILANVGHKGKTIDDVNNALDELNEYADQTIYNFTEMTKNIGLFTNAGVGLDESVSAIKGFSNAAAMAGVDSTRTSAALYQLSQAMSAGVVKLMDWRSLTTANIAGERFEDVIKATAKVHGVNVDAMIEKEGTFQNTLKDNWLTAEIMSEALNHYTLSTKTMTEAEVEANRERLKAQGYTEEQIDMLFEVGTTATGAATEIKDLSQMFDVLKESAQSGWSTTWRLIFGDLIQAKAIFTPLTNFFSDIIDKTSDWRNAILESAFAKNFKEIGERVQSILKPITKTTETVKGMVDGLKDYGTIVNEIISGDWGNGQSRWDKLTEAGYDWAHAQNLVNEKLGDSTRHATNYTEKQKEQAKTTADLTEKDAKLLEELNKLSDAELKAKGYTNEQIEALRELGKIADKLGLSISDLITNIDEIDGRWLFIESFKNAGKGLVKVFHAMKAAWQDIFPPKTTEEYGEMLFNVIAAIHKFSTKLIMSKETADSFRRTLRGVFAALDIILTVVGGPLKIAFKILTQILGAFDLNILDLTAIIGDAIYKFRNWLKRTLDFTATIKKLTPYLKKAAKAIKDWIGSLKDSETIKNITSWIKESAIAFKNWIVSIKDSKIIKDLASWLRESAGALKDWIAGFKEADNIPKYIIQGLWNGLKNGISKIVEIAIELGGKILESIKKVLGIHSPSKEMEEVGENTIAGFLQGIKNGFSKVWEALKNFGSKCIEIVKNIDFGALLGVGIIASVLIVANKLVNVLDKIANPLDKLGGMFDNIGTGIKKMCTSIGTNFKAKAFERVSNALLNFAKAIGILVVSVIALTYVAKNNSGDMWEAFGMIASLAALLTIPILALVALAVICKKQEADFENVVSAFGKIGRAFLAIAIAITIFNRISWKAVGKAGAVLGGLLLFIVVITWMANKCKSIGNVSSIENVFMKIAKAFLAIAAAVFIFNIISWKAVAKAGTTLGGLLVFVAAISLMANFCKNIGNVSSIENVFMKIAKAFLVIAAAVFIFNTISWKAVGKAGAVLGGLLVFVLILAAVIQKTNNSLVSGDVKSLGDNLLAVAKSILILSIAMRLLGGMSWDQFWVAAAGMAGLTLMIDILVQVVKKVYNDVPNIGTTLIAIAGAIAILAVVVKILGSMTWDQLTVAAVGMAGLTIVIAYLINVVQKASQDAPRMGKTLLAIAGAIAILAAITVILGLVKLGNLLQGGIAVAVLGGIVALILRVAKNSEKAMKPILAMVAMIAVLGTILIILSKMDSGKAILGAVSLGIALLAIAGAMAIISHFGGGLAGGGALALAAVGLIAIAAAMYILAAIPGEKIVQSIFLLVVALVALCGVAALFSFFAAGAAILVGTLLGIAAVVVAVGIAAIAFAGALYIVGLALPLIANGLALLITSLAGCYEHAGKFVVVCLALFVGLALLAIPLVIIAAGVLLIGVAFGLVAVSALVFVAALTILALILPLLSEGLEKLCNVILQFSEKAGEILVTMLALAAGIAVLGLAAIVAGAGVAVFGVGLAVCAVALVVVAVAVLLVVGALWGMSYVLPSLIENVASCGGSMENFKNVMSTVGTSVLEFLLKLAAGLAAFGLGAIVAGAGAVVLAVGVAVLSVAILIGAVAVLALAAAFYLLGKALDVTVQAAEAGKNLVLGFAQGIVDSISTVINTVKDFCGTVVGKVKEFLGIHSPSTIMQALGLNTGEGFALGLDDSKAGVEESAEGLAQTAKDGMSEAGTEGGSSFTSGLSDSIDLSSLGLGDSLNMDSIKSSFGSAGTEGGSSFTSGLSDSIDLSSLGLGDSLNMDSIKSSFGSAGTEGGSAFNTGLSGGLEGSNITSSITSEVDENQATVISKFKTLGSDSATAFKTGLSTNLDLSKVDIGSLDTETIKRQFASAGTVSGASFTTALRTALSTLSINDKLSSMLTAIVGYNSKMKQAGTNLGACLSTGLNSKKEAIKTASESLATAAKSAIKNQTQYEKFVKAGKYLGAGLVEGIEAKESAVYWAAYALGQAAVQGEKDGQESESPSKATIKAGKWLGEGLVIGIKKMGSQVYKAGSILGEMATGTISKAVSSISDAINSDIDAQPTIRPVLDLSDVRAGAGSINALFSGRTLAVDMAGVGAVSASMAGFQNGSDSKEIVSGIKALRKDIANMPRNTYNVNGVTYDDGSNVSDSVGELVRAIKIERRK